jgi:carbon-monoxide dehydrogenase medium subunit
MANPRTYHRPTSLREAIELVSTPGSRALSGGGLTLNQLDIPYETLVDLQDIPELREITRIDDNGAALGGAIVLQQVIEQTYLPAPLRRALTRAVPPNVRNCTSILESLISRTLLPEWLTILAAHNVLIDKIETNGTERRYTFSEIVASVLGSEKAAEQIGIVRRLVLPHLDRHEALGAACVSRSPGDEPIVCAAAYIGLNADQRTVERPFVAVFGVSESPVAYIALEQLRGSPLDEANIVSAAKQVAPQVAPAGDWRGSADYRREMARVCVKRALEECLEQLRANRSLI